MSTTTLSQPPEPRSPVAAERRGRVRYHCHFRAPARYAIGPRFYSDWAVLHDLSATGAGLLLHGAPEPGAVLLLQLPSNVPGCPSTHLSRVVHARERPAGDYLVGCALTPPLSEAELASVRQRLGWLPAN
jgi:hypothetical protein